MINPIKTFGNGLITVGKLPFKGAYELYKLTARIATLFSEKIIHKGEHHSTGPGTQKFRIDQGTYFQAYEDISSADLAKLSH